MKIVIVGYGEMLQAVVSGVLKTKHQIVGVFRHENVLYRTFLSRLFEKIKPSIDFNYIRTLKLYDIKANSVNSQEFRDELKKLKADVVLVASWSEKFSMQTINMLKHGCINVHPALLPKHRGPNPYIHVIMNQEPQSGVTFHQMDVNYDTGAILHQASIPVLTNDTGMSLKLRCCDLAHQEVQVLLNNFKEKILNPISQNEKEATYQAQFPLADCILDFEKETAAEIDRKIRALTPWAKTFIPHKNQFFEFENYKIYNKTSEKDAAQIIRITENSVFIVCADKNVIEFSGLKLKSPLHSLFTSLYLHKFLKVNSKAV